MAQNIFLFKHREGNVIASAVAGGAILLFLAVVIFVMPEPTDFQRGVLRFFIAISAALLATFFLGGVVLQGNLAGSKVGAGGGFALFVLIQFLFDPLKIQTIAADAVPQAVPPRQEVKQAQAALSRAGVYSGAVDGIPGAATRNAIKKFQSVRGIPATGYVDPPTEKAFQEAAKQTSVFEGEAASVTEGQRAAVMTLVNEKGLKTSLAIQIIFDTVVHAGSANAKRYSDQATTRAGGAPITGVSERTWLLEFLQARKKHLEKTMPKLASSINETRISKLRAQVVAMPE